MKVLKVFWKSLKEQVRDSVTLGLSLVIGPFFILLYWLMIPSGSTTYDVLIQNLDLGSKGQEVTVLLETLAYPSGDPLLKVTTVSSQARAEDQLRDRDAEVLLIIPEDFSSKLQTISQGDFQNPAQVTLVGDLTNFYYAIGVVMAGSVIDEFVQEQTGEIRPF